MKTKQILNLAILIVALTTVASAQILKRTATKVERASLGAAGSVIIVGAPAGSILIEAWQKPEVEVTAEIEVQAESEADLAVLAKANNFVLDEDLNSVRIYTTGAHDKQFIRRNFKDFPKRLLAAPFKIDYTIRVPFYCDLTVDAGRGNFNLRGVEGAISIKALEAENATLDLVGGILQATFGAGKINVNLPQRSWRGAGIEVQLAKGELNVSALQSLNADLDLSVLQAGKIETKFENLQPRQKAKFSDVSMLTRAGSGGARMIFTVTEGTLRLTQQ